MSFYIRPISIDDVSEEVYDLANVFTKNKKKYDLEQQAMLRKAIMANCNSVCKIYLCFDKKSESHVLVGMIKLLLEPKIHNNGAYVGHIEDVAVVIEHRHKGIGKFMVASGSAGKLAVFAVRVDTFDKPKAEQVFYVGTNDPEQLNEIRRRLLTECSELPEMGEYMHQSWFDGADRYCKDTFLLIKYLGTDFLPRLYRIKAALDRWLEKIPGLPNRPADHLLQRLAQLWPDHLPKRMREYRKTYEHHLILVGADTAIAEIRQVLHEVTRVGDVGAFFECSPKEGDAALLHRLVAGGSPARYNLIHAKETNGMVTFDVALPRNYAKWYEFLPEDLLDQCAAPYRGGHFMCHVFHWDFVVKAGVEPEAVKERMMALLDSIGAKYPAEHNVGHLYCAEPDHAAFYRELDPTNTFNAGVGKMSKYRCYH